VVSFPQVSPPKLCIQLSSSPYVPYAPRISFFSISGVKSGISSYNFLHSPVIPYLLGPNILLSTIFSNTHSLRSSLNVRDQVSHPYKRTAKLYFCINIYIFLDSKLEDKRSCTKKKKQAFPRLQSALNFSLNTICETFIK